MFCFDAAVLEIVFPFNEPVLMVRKQSLCERYFDLSQTVQTTAVFEYR